MQSTPLLDILYIRHFPSYRYTPWIVIFWFADDDAKSRQGFKLREVYLLAKPSLRFLCLCSATSIVLVCKVINIHTKYYLTSFLEINQTL